MEHVLSGYLLQLHEDLPDFPLVGDGMLQPRKLLGAQSNGHGFGSHAPGPLVARPTLAGFIALYQTS